MQLMDRNFILGQKRLHEILTDPCPDPEMIPQIKVWLQAIQMASASRIKVDENSLRRQEISILPRLRAALEEAKAKRLG